MRKKLKEEHRKSVQKIEDFLKKGDFYLAGGTAVYYYLNHRESLDLDFFTKRKIDFRNWKPIFEKFEIMEYTDFEDADKEGDLKMIKKISWDKIKKYFIKKFVEV
ncbi:nucleotidyl transferase AbiEii/AbiGii toxin family protein [Thermodesulfobacterium hveragerdense]|jgi:hypothetical protein|uniref:nucleotidyl transferase AbiEii/AbiGii toxin family protein n=1 Tax=Thermodesulfobacterium hveragerdense TaxID=53424 RepID=UPI00048AFF63|nr:nucleotidyl transferase AbiEii/AbiGii toxin family protein [Thermodesulfobacterium hveragerdense]